MIFSKKQSLLKITVLSTFLGLSLTSSVFGMGYLPKSTTDSNPTPTPTSTATPVYSPAPMASPTPTYSPIPMTSPIPTHSPTPTSTPTLTSSPTTPTELCDPTQTTPNQISQTTTPVCGNNRTEENEECDGGDGCHSDCTAAICGDGILDQMIGEECDDGNTENNDGCSSKCFFEYLCNDPDGKNIFNQGTTLQSRILPTAADEEVNTETVEEKTDFCRNRKTVNEYICSQDAINEEKMSCGSDSCCLNGACLPDDGTIGVELDKCPAVVKIQNGYTFEEKTVSVDMFGNKNKIIVEGTAKTHTSWDPVEECVITVTAYRGKFKGEKDITYKKTCSGVNECPFEIDLYRPLDAAANTQSDFLDDGGQINIVTSASDSCCLVESSASTYLILRPTPKFKIFGFHGAGGTDGLIFPQLNQTIKLNPNAGSSDIANWAKKELFQSSSEDLTCKKYPNFALHAYSMGGPAALRAAFTVGKNDNVKIPLLITVDPVPALMPETAFSVGSACAMEEDCFLAKTVNIDSAINFYQNEATTRPGFPNPFGLIWNDNPRRGRQVLSATNYHVSDDDVTTDDYVLSDKIDKDNIPAVCQGNPSSNGSRPENWHSMILCHKTVIENSSLLLNNMNLIRNEYRWKPEKKDIFPPYGYPGPISNCTPIQDPFIEPIVNLVIDHAVCDKNNYWPDDDTNNTP